MKLDLTALTHDERLALLNALHYAGGGYYRDSRTPKGETAIVLHGAELIELAKLLLSGKENARLIS